MKETQIIKFQGNLLANSNLQIIKVESVLNFSARV